MFFIHKMLNRIDWVAWMGKKKSLRLKKNYNELFFNYLEVNIMKEKMNLNPQNEFLRN
jgi:hypothetical protein